MLLESTRQVMFHCSSGLEDARDRRTPDVRSLRCDLWIACDCRGSQVWCEIKLRSSLDGLVELETTGAGSGSGAMGVAGSGAVSTGCTTTIGAIICRFQYETAIPRCQNRGISSKKRMICESTNALKILSEGMNLIQHQIPPARIMAATIVDAT